MKVSGLEHGKHCLNQLSEVDAAVPGHGHFTASFRTGGGPAAGADMSHRGGSPGFVQLAPDHKTLRWADFTGNDMFNTLGE